MKKNTNFKSIISGAVIGGIVSSMLTVGIVGYNEKSITADPVFNSPGMSYSEFDVQQLSEDTEKKALSIEEIAKKVGPSIVGITCETSVQSYFGIQKGESGGSGIVINDTGNIVTNYHVIDGGKEIKVKLTSGNEYAATVVGGDERMDIAVLKIDAKEELHAVTIGNSDEVEVGSLAVAIGNPLASELFGTVTAGVISGVNRTITVGQRDMTLIQTDAAISPGNSGGALINKYGEVIGINTVKLVDSAAEGLGFAIPMNEAAPIINDLMKYGYVKGRPVIGVSVRELTREIAYYNNLLSDHGLYIMSVTEGSGAEKAGLSRGDIILKLNGKDVTSSAELNAIRDKHKAGDTVTITILRGAKEMTFNLVLTEDVPAGKKAG